MPTVLAWRVTQMAVRRLSRIVALTAWAMLLVLPQAWAQARTEGGVLPVPALTGHVVDQAQALSSDAARALDDKLSRFEAERGTQMVVLLVPTTQPEDIAAYAQRVGDTWKIGRREVGDGLLLVVALQDRRVRIEVAKALEGAVPDLAASRVIEQAITPSFRRGDIAAGLNAGVDRLMALITGENLPAPQATGSNGARRPGFGLDQLFVFGLIGIPIVSGVLGAIFGRKAGALLTGAVGGGIVWVITASLLLGLAGGVMAVVLALAMGKGGRGGPGGFGGWGPPGGGWGGGGGGGWSSGGGGDFGGGGASGRW